MFKSLKDILPGTIEELGISEQLKRAAVFAAWRALAAELPGSCPRRASSSFSAQYLGR